MHFSHLRAFSSYLAGFLLSSCIGMVSFYPSPALPSINGGNYGFKLSEDQMSWLASVIGLSATVGSIAAVPLMDKYGRKPALTIITIPLAVGWILTVSSFNVATLMTGRAILGLAIGMVGTCVTPYLAEIAPRKTRGIVSMLSSFGLYFGGFSMNLLGSFIDWRWLAGVGLATVVVTTLTTLAMYETPRWLVSNGHKQLAAEVMTTLWHIDNPELIEKEIHDIEEDAKLVPRFVQFKGLIQSLNKTLWRPLIITQLLVMFQQFTGYGYIINFTVTIFTEATMGLKTTSPLLSNPNYQSCVVCVAFLFGCTMSTLFIDRLGRRFFLITSGVVITVSLTAIGAYYYILATDLTLVSRYLSWLPLVFLITYVIGYSFSYGGIPNLLLSELFPIHFRGVSNGLGVVNHGLCYFIAVKVFPAVGHVPNYGHFWIYAGISFISLLFIIGCVPETKGLSLEEIQQQQHYTSRNLANKTNGLGDSSRL